MSALVARRMRAVVVATFCALPLGLLPAPSMSEGHAMSSRQEQASRLLELPAQEYFDIGEERLVELQTALGKIADDDNATPLTPPPPPLLAIGAPRTFAESQEHTLPVLVGSFQSGQRAWEVNLRSNLWLVLRSLSTGELAVITPFMDMRRGDAPLLSGVGIPPSAATARSTFSAVHPIDLRAQIERQVNPGRYVLTAVEYDLRSNTVGLELLGDVPEPRPEAMRPQAYVVVGDAAPAALEAGIHVPLHVSAREPIAIDLARQLGADDGVLGSATPQPVWICHILILQPDEPPIIVPAAVPVHRMEPAAGVPRFNAVVRIDLDAAVSEPLLGAYQVYVDVGRELLGPYPMTVTH